MVGWLHGSAYFAEKTALTVLFLAKKLPQGRKKNWVKLRSHQKAPIGGKDANREISDFSEYNFFLLYWRHNQ